MCVGDGFHDVPNFVFRGTKNDRDGRLPGLVVGQSHTTGNDRGRVVLDYDS